MLPHITQAALEESTTEQILAQAHLPELLLRALRAHQEQQVQQGRRGTQAEAEAVVQY